MKILNIYFIVQYFGASILYLCINIKSKHYGTNSCKQKTAVGMR